MKLEVRLKLFEHADGRVNSMAVEQSVDLLLASDMPYNDELKSYAMHELVKQVLVKIENCLPYLLDTFELHTKGERALGKL